MLWNTNKKGTGRANAQNMEQMHQVHEENAPGGKGLAERCRCSLALRRLRATIWPLLFTSCNHYFAELPPTLYLAVKENLKRSQHRPLWLGTGKAKAGCTRQWCASPGGLGATPVAVKAFAKLCIWKRGQWLWALWKAWLSWSLSLGKQRELGP